eukprot:COSAG06_NODE_4587_length_4122_cov_2.670147_2_plen_87_part_00
MTCVVYDLRPRIISRKTSLLVVATLLAKQPLLVGPACTDSHTGIWLSNAESARLRRLTLAARKQHLNNTPSSWSRGDVLEALSLGS